MPEMTTVTLQVPVELRDRLDRLAAVTGRSRSGLVAEALAAYLAEAEDHLAAVEQGLADAAAGRVVSHEEVERWLSSWGTADELPPPQCD